MVKGGEGRGVSTHHTSQQPKPDQQRPEQGDCPMLVILRRPAVDQQARRNATCGRARQDEGQAVLGLHLVAARLDAAQSGVAELANEGEPEDHADADADVRQADGAAAEAVLPLEDEGEGREEQIQDPVDHRHVQRHEADDGREEEHLGRPDDGADQELLVRDARVELAAQAGIAGFFAEALGLAGEEDGRERLAEEGEAGDCDGAGLLVSV